MGVNVNEGASRIAQLLQPEQSSDSAPELETAEQPETVEVETTEVVEETDHEHNDVEDSEEETPEGDTEPEEPRYKVTVNGEEQDVSIEDMKKGYMMESDYRKKTSEVARHRDENKVKEEALSSKLLEAEAMLSLDIEDLNSEENRDLKEYDRSAYEEKKEKLEAKRNRLAELKQEDQTRQQENQTARIGKEKELLLNALPEWLDEKVLTEEAGMVNTMWETMGFTPQELAAFSDHRLVILSRKAALYDKLKAAKPESKKVQAKPKSARAGTVKSSEDKSRNRSQDARARLKKTGNMRDAQSAIKSLLSKQVAL